MFRSLLAVAYIRDFIIISSVVLKLRIDIGTYLVLRTAFRRVSINFRPVTGEIRSRTNFPYDKSNEFFFF